MTAAWRAALTNWCTTILPGGLVALAAVAAYYHSFHGPFIHDDLTSIIDNHSIRQLWPIGPVLSPPPNGETVSGRPLLNLSLAVNYAISRLDVRSYHAANLLIHIAAALLLMGVLRRTFLLPASRGRFGRAATPLALAGALIWVLHPLQTESVTYVAQRAESLVGLFYLLTLYCVIRGAGERGTRDEGRGARDEGREMRDERQGDTSCSPPAPRPWPLAPFWYAAAVWSCLLGMASKEVMVTAPLIVLLYDRTFLSGSFREAWRRRWGLYVGLAATWALLGYLVLSTGLIGRQTELGAPDAFSYARSQPGVILYYLRLAVWPKPLCLDYAWPVANTPGEILPGLVVVGALMAATVWGLMARKAWGFLGAWFFLILGPTSSILPLKQLAFEHRMYLSLAALAVLAVTGGYALWERLLLGAAKDRGQSLAWLRWFAALGPRPSSLAPRPSFLTPRLWAVPLVFLTAVLTALGYATAARNWDYRSPLAIWQDTVRKSPGSWLAHNNLGIALDGSGRPGEAIEHYRQALQLKPDFAEARNNLGLALATVGRPGEAIEHYRQALRLKPDFAGAEANLGTALAAAGRPDEAIAHYDRALRLKADDPNAHYTMGRGLKDLGRTAEAIARFQEALRLRPDYPDAHNALGAVLAETGKTDEAIAHYRQALRLDPDFAEAHSNLANVLTAVGNRNEAIEHYREALRIKPDLAEAHYNLANALTIAGRTSEAIEHYQQAVRLKPDINVARYNLAYLLAGAGRTREAIAHYQQLLQQEPNSPDALCGLAWVLATHESAQGGDPAEAIRLAEQARGPGGQENVRCLDTLAAAYAAAGRFSEAVAAAQRALQLAESAGLTALASQIRSRLDLYRAERPYREEARSAAPPKP